LAAFAAEELTRGESQAVASNTSSSNDDGGDGIEGGWRHEDRHQIGVVRPSDTQHPS